MARPLSPEAQAVRQWLVVARMPPFDTLVTDPLFFKRALVVHVNLALVSPAWCT